MTGGSCFRQARAHGEDKNCALLFAPVEEATLYGPIDPQVKAYSDSMQAVTDECTNYENLPFSVSDAAACIQDKAYQVGYDTRGVVVGPQDGHGAAQEGLVYYRSPIRTEGFLVGEDSPPVLAQPCLLLCWAQASCLPPRCDCPAWHGRKPFTALRECMQIEQSSASSNAQTGKHVDEKQMWIVPLRMSRVSCGTIHAHGVGSVMKGLCKA